MAAKKTAKDMTFISEDVSEFINQSQFLNDSPSPKPKKTLKSAGKNEGVEEEDISKLIGEYQARAKKKKTETSSETNPEYRKKILDLVGNQLQARKQRNENLFKSLSEIITQVEADYNVLKENEQKLEHLTENYMKCIQIATAAYKRKLKALKEIHISFKNQCDEMESDHKMETEKVVNELEYDIKNLQDKLVAETKRSGWESVRRSLLNAMNNDF